MKKNIIVLFLTFFSCFLLISENLLLKDGKIFKGELVYLDKERITMKIENELYDFKISSIEYLIVPTNQLTQRLLYIKRKDNTELSINLIKLTETVIYYKMPNGNELMLLKLSDVFAMSVLNSNNNIANNSNKKIFLEKDDFDNINSDITEILINLARAKSILSDEIRKEIEQSSKKDSVIIDNPDFYDKFWLRVSNYIDKNTENLLWGLVENYSEKEKSINIFYNEKSNINSNKIIEEYKSKIIELRKEFYKRARRIIISQIK
ncbi:MAG TPA: hypothetical protein PLE45_04335 [Spirochaetota bacterium]|nr:hypothetical protein [Spirochaetota bacterium]HOL56465.1 hypothetical protein [Spirochaetota bacterium]HPP03388.1 hypothetical protein [Spirochaetota bacterium]